MKKLFGIVFTLIIFIIGAALIVPFLIPLDTYKKEAVAKLSALTGRDIQINGDIEFRLLPDVAIGLNDVTIGNPSGFTSPFLAKLERLDLGVELQPLFNKEVVIQNFALQKPDIYLEKTASGAANWNIEFNKEAAKNAESEAPASTEEKGKSFELNTFALEELSIKNGKLTYVEPGTKHTISEVTLSSNNVTFDQQTTFDGSLKWNDKPIQFNAQLGSLEALSNGQPTDSQIALDSDVFKVNFAGKLSTNGIRGSLDAGTKSLVKAMQWLGKPMDYNKTPLLVAVKGQANCNTARCEISGGNYAVDNIRLNGDLAINYSDKLSVTGDLSGDTLDITPYLDQPQAALDSISLVKPAFAQSSHWSNDPIDVSSLGAANVDLILDLKKLVLPKVTVKNIKAQPQIRNGSASVNIIQSEVFGGSASGVLTALPRDNYMNGSAKVNLKNINTESFLQTFTGDAKISGTTDLDMSLTARGNSVASLVQTMSGDANLKILNGAIKGVNLAQMGRNIKSAFTAEKTTEDTDFAELTASFNVKNGTIFNQDLYMKAPYMRVNGEGQINLYAYTISYRLTPELVDTSKGQGGSDEKQGIMVPILVTGSLDNPKFAPDIKSMLENPEQIKENIEAVKDRIKSEKENLKQTRDDIKQQVKDIKKTVKEDPKELLKDPNKINNLLGGFGLGGGTKTQQPAAEESVVQPNTQPIETAPVQADHAPTAEPAQIAPAPQEASTPTAAETVTEAPAAPTEETPPEATPAE